MYMKAHNVDVLKEREGEERQREGDWPVDGCPSSLECIQVPGLLPLVYLDIRVQPLRSSWRVWGR